MPRRISHCSFWGRIATPRYVPTDPLDLLVADLVHEGLAACHPLSPLSADESVRLLSGWLSDAAFTADDATAADVLEADGAWQQDILAWAGGIPLYLQSCLEEACRQARTGIQFARRLPAGASDSIRQRIAVLSLLARRMLAIAAVGGRQLARPLLVRIATELEKRKHLCSTLWKRSCEPVC